MVAGDAFFFEKRARQKGYSTIAGVDEAGRGPLAGPVVAAACILEEDFFLPQVDDSKKLSPAKRKELFDKLTQDSRVCYCVSVLEADVIDKFNILQATLRAMEIALSGLKKKPDYVLVDGSIYPPRTTIRGEAVIQGDALSYTIAAASILAKETRDRIMLAYHEKWPEYGFAKHKGYPTKAHVEAVKRLGPCPIHRRTFSPIKEIFSQIILPSQQS